MGSVPTRGDREIPKPPPALVEAIKAGNATFFVGSGLSLDAGAPSWQDLLMGLCAEADAISPRSRSDIAQAITATYRGRLLDAASIIKQVLKSEFPMAICRQMELTRRVSVDQSALAAAEQGQTSQPLFNTDAESKPRQLRPTRCHRIIAQLNLAAIVTTNYDMLLETALPPRSPCASLSRSDRNVRHYVRRRIPFILKLHGDIRHPDDLVLAREDYSEVVNDAMVQEFCRLLVGTTAPFWIGYGHNDPNLDLLVDEMWVKYRLPGGFAVAKEGDSLLQTRLDRIQFVTSWLKTYGDFYYFLRELAAASDCPITYYVTLDMPWPGNERAKDIGEELASELSRLEGAVDFVDAEEGSVRILLESSSTTLSQLRRRLARRDTEIFSILQRCRVISLDTDEVPLPSGAAFQPGEPEDRTTDVRSALVGSSGWWSDLATATPSPENIACLFPGQGAQTVGMAKRACESTTAARELFDRANSILGYALDKLCFDGPVNKLDSTAISQPAVFVSSLAAIEVLRSEQPEVVAACKAVAGLSLGEFTALVFAGVMDFETGLRLVQLRGEAMQLASSATPTGMVSILGLDVESVEGLCVGIREAGDFLYVANYLCPGNIVVAGSQTACARVSELAESAGAMKSVQLSVAGAFHTPIMESAADRLVDALSRTPLSNARIPVISNVDAKPHSDPVEIRELLEKHMVMPVLWESSMRYLLDAGLDIFFEVGPGRVLRGLLRRINRTTVCRGVSV